MDNKAVAAHIVVVGLIAVHAQHGKQRNKLQALAQHVFRGVVVGPGIVAVQRKHAARKGIHHVGAGCLHNDVAHKVGGQCAVGRKLGAEFFQLLLFGKLTEQKQVHNLFKAKAPLGDKAAHNVAHIYPAVIQAALAGRFHAVLHFKGHNVAYLGKARQHAVAVQIAQAALYVVFGVQCRVYGRIADALAAQLADIRRCLGIINALVNGHEIACLSLFFVLNWPE